MLERKTLKRINGRFKSIKDRCNNPKKKDYKLYGARGIKCEFNYIDFKEWLLKSFENLGIDTTKDQSVLKALDTYSVDRVDSNDSYSILNCTLTERRENEYLQLVEVNHIRLDSKTYAPLWLFDVIQNKKAQRTNTRTKVIKFASEFSFDWGKRRLDIVWFDFSKPPLFVKDGKVQCPICKTHFVPQRVLECECGFHTKEAKTIKKPQNREEVRIAEKKLYRLLGVVK